MSTENTRQFAEVFALAQRLAEGAREAADSGDSRPLNDALNDYDRLVAARGLYGPGSHRRAADAALKREGS